MAYPWQVSRVDNALEVLRLQGVDETDVQEIEKNLPDITRDTPRSLASATRSERRVSLPTTWAWRSLAT